MSIRRSSLICVAYLQVYERVADNRWWPNIGGLLYSNLIPLVYNSFSRPLNVPVQHGVFTVQLTMVSSDGNNYTSIATVSVSSLVNITTLTMTCDDNGDGIGENALLINGIMISLHDYFY